ncbi:aminotransferase class I/II-fold pyridoxal phosphate-dependent enzyme [Cylindrospermopsis raciborskii]|uniref:Decarboxylase n=1 Tax=Cylindrospermopsis raciborskii CENA302 TaxID=1170768 RepID=A0A9Q5W8Y5_9CYAN|nr:aminotransferase class I/II-fold pyridoxal phosphate-dependent enzyme [Cylindrospermopsis raciborskii]OPH09509.1 decarboxylase [Cylindrospermopsis raciborskii CENA302]
MELKASYKHDELSTYKMIADHYPDIKLPLHTPAHQGIKGESECFDDLIYSYDLHFFNREGFDHVEREISELYQTNRTFFLTGGATQGILIACAILARKHKRIAIGQNSHLSVIHGFILSGLEPFFMPSHSLMPTDAEIIQALETTAGEVTALFLTHPSYDGITTDLNKISQYCRHHNIEFIVDEAHGTHFPFLPAENLSAVATECDLVVHSLHKFVGSLVQTALIHLPKTSTITEAEVLTAIALFETTSRSNLLLLSIEEAIRLAFGDERRSLFQKAADHCHQLRCFLDKWGTTLTYDPQVSDPLKIFLYSDRATGHEIGELIFEQGIDYEYSNDRGVLLIFSFQNIDHDLLYVQQVFEQIYQIIAHKEQIVVINENLSGRSPIIRCSPREAFFSNNKKLVIQEAKGMVSCSCIKEIPPCIPILIPGEEITDWHLEKIQLDTLVEVIN